MTKENTKYCKNCGALIDFKAEICPKCGVRIAPPESYTCPQITQPKNEGIAAVLSFLFTGLGQIYNGEITKGILFIIIGGIMIFSMLFLIGFLLFPLFWIFNIYDAYTTAKIINKQKHLI